MLCRLIPFPQELRPRLPTIVGNVDYQTLRQRLEQIDEILRLSGLERDFVQRALRRWTSSGKRAPTAHEQLKFQQRSRRALRCNILRTLLQEDSRRVKPSASSRLAALFPAITYWFSPPRSLMGSRLSHLPVLGL